MIEIIKDVQLEISLIVIAVYILYSLKKEKSEGLITLASFVIAIIVWMSHLVLTIPTPTDCLTL